MLHGPRPRILPHPQMPDPAEARPRRRDHSGTDALGRFPALGRMVRGRICGDVSGDAHRAGGEDGQGSASTESDGQDEETEGGTTTEEGTVRAAFLLARMTLKAYGNGDLWSAISSEVELRRVLPPGKPVTIGDASYSTPARPSWLAVDVIGLRWRSMETEFCPGIRRVQMREIASTGGGNASLLEIGEAMR